MTLRSIAGLHALQHIHRSLRLFLAVACGLGAGCGVETSGPTRFDLSGTVTYDGKPVPSGRIQFLPDTSEGNTGPAGYASITDGKYDTTRDGKGTVGGPHIVVINGFIGPPPANVQSDDELTDNSLFPEHRTSIELPQSTSTLDFDVPGDD